MSLVSTRLLAYTGLAVGALTVAAAAMMSGRPKVEPGSRVFLLGDSFAIGLSRPMSALARDSKVSFDWMATSGARIDQLSSNSSLYQRIVRFKPTHILVSLGTNDEYMNIDARVKQAPHLKRLLQNLRSYAPVFWIGPPKLPKATTNGTIPLILDEVPSSHYFPSQDLKISRGPDRLHPTTAGYALWAGEIWKWLT